MKNAFVFILAVLTFGSLGYGYYQSMQKTDLVEKLEVADMRALAAELEARKQSEIAMEQRKAAEAQVVAAQRARQAAEQAMADCQKRKR